MKKIIGLIFILCLSTEICFSETRKLEGYDGLTWGTTLEEFKKLNPDAFEQSSEEDNIRNERLFFKEGKTVTRIYRFFDNKLYWGRTAYTNPSEATFMAIFENLREEYGSFYDFNKGSEKDYDYSVLSWYVSSNLTVMLETRDFYNTYGRIIGSYAFITYQNYKTRIEIENYEKEQRKKNLEL